MISIAKASKAAVTPTKKDEGTAKGMAKRIILYTGGLAGVAVTAMTIWELQKPPTEAPTIQPEHPATTPSIGTQQRIEPRVIEVFRDQLEDGSQGPEMVMISERSFAIGKYEITFDEYDRFAQAAGWELPSDEGWGRGNRPVINVSWNDANDYTTWLSEQTGKRYRLPTEKEWNYANRAGSTTSYWWGDEIGTSNANCDGCGSQWDNQQTAPVGSFAPNPFGLHDTLGNVWEWVHDPPSEEPWSQRARTFRGGAWYMTPGNLRSDTRGGRRLDYSFNGLGFRIARDIP